MSFFKRLLNLGRDEQLARDIEREISFHIRERVEELRVQGFSESDAVLQARRQFGNPTYQSERTREANVVTWLDSLKGDLGYALRALRRSPAFASVAIASLSLGIGANTAIYTLLDAVVLRSLAVPNPEQLVQVTAGDEDKSGYFTNPLWEQIRDGQAGFTATAAFSQTTFNVADGGEVRRINGEWVSGDYFRLFGMRAAVGRLPTRADDVRGCGATAVVSHGFWQSEYGGRRDILGTAISLEGKPFTITGVTAPGFAGPVVGRAVHLYVPLCAEAVLRGSASVLDGRSTSWLRIIGRRDPAVTFEEAKARLKSLAPAAYAATVPERFSTENQTGYRKSTLSLLPAETGLSGIRNRYSRALAVMMGAVALVLLIACANVANLLLARAAGRQREIAIRLAIGAARRRLVRQLVTESVLLAGIGAAAGLVVAYWGSRGLVALISSDSNPVSLDLSLNLRVLGFTALVAAITATLFGLVPAWRGTRISPQSAMKANSRGVAEGHGRFMIGKSLVVAQVALSLTLLTGAGLLVGSLRNLRTMDPGFTAEGVLIVGANFRRTGITREQTPELFNRILERVRALPGMRFAASSNLTPLGNGIWNNKIYVDGFTPATANDDVVWFNEVSDGYFATLDTKLLAGRDFDRSDVPGGPKAVVVNEAMARKFFGDAAPLGRQFRTKSGDTFDKPYTIVGVVASSKYGSLREKESATVYEAASQNSRGSTYLTLLIRAERNPMSLVLALKSLYADVHRSVTLDFTRLDEQLAGSLRRERMLALLSALFGGVALALSMLGLYGVMAYTVARRRNEIGVRIALGANQSRVLRMVLGDVGRVVAVGIVLGTVGALASGKLVASFLYGLQPAEPWIMGAAAAALSLVALGAGVVPAWRASRVDPVAALREE